MATIEYKLLHKQYVYVHIYVKKNVVEDGFFFLPLFKDILLEYLKKDVCSMNLSP